MSRDDGKQEQMKSRLYVGNLAFDTTEATIQGAFAKCGEVAEVKLILDRETGRSRGFAFVTMATPEGAQRAIAEINGVAVDGRMLRVNEAEERRERSGGGGGGGFSRSREGGGDFGGGGFDRGGGGGGFDRPRDRDRDRDRGGRGGRGDRGRRR